MALTLIGDCRRILRALPLCGVREERRRERETNFHGIDTNRFNISSVSCFPPTPFSPPGPTHEGQPSA